MRGVWARAAGPRYDRGSMSRALWTWTRRVEARLLLLALAVAVVASSWTARGKLRDDAASESERAGRAHHQIELHLLPVLDLATAEPSRPFVPMTRLFPLHIVAINSRDSADLRLYGRSGDIDPVAAVRLEQLFADTRNPSDVRVGTIDRRVMQLLFKAAYHFRVRNVVLISGYRERIARSEGLHGVGSAVDFKLAKVPAAKLAAYLRTLPRVGVGLYTHPKTQFVHLDDRADSFHWVDGSGPGRRGRERRLRTAGLAKRDARYLPWDDWPEGTLPEGI
jgi:uncharacterized protein YcbK (DUF882 family)